MTPFAVVEDLDVFKETALRSLVVEPAIMVNQLGLEQNEKRLGHGVAPTVALAAHALHEAVPGKPLCEISTGVLDAAIGVDDKPSGRLPSGPLQSRQHHGVIQARTECPADHTPRVEVDEDDQIQPATTDAQIGQIAYPHLILALGGEVALQKIRSTGYRCLESVVTRKRRRTIELSPSSRMHRAT